MYGKCVWIKCCSFYVLFLFTEVHGTRVQLYDGMDGVGEEIINLFVELN